MFFDVCADNGVQYVKSSLIGTKHAFTTRFGGVSGGVYASLNLGEHRGDDNERVRENYRLVKEAVGIHRLVFAHQVHGCEVREATSADAHELFADIPFDADALVTGDKSVGLVIFIADCIPILFHDPATGLVGAAHAGWRGTVAGIAERTVEKMCSLGARARDIRAAIGPGIGFCCFETGPEVPEALRGALGNEAEGFIAASVNAGHYMVDLKGANRAMLLRAGLMPENIDVSAECTRCLNEKYWSHRFTGGVRGSQAAIIGG